MLFSLGFIFLKDDLQLRRRMQDGVSCCENRLVTSGVPAILEHRAAAAASASTSAAIVAECVQNFFTVMDFPDMVAVDQVHPLLSDLSASLNKLSILLPNFEVKTDF